MENQTFNLFYVFYADGYSEKCTFPSEYSSEDVLKETGAVEVSDPIPMDPEKAFYTWG